MARGPDGRPWRFDLEIGAGPDGAPLYERLARAIVTDVQRGRLLPGALLPGSRTLAAALGVNRKVVVAAVAELVAQGWLESLPARGTRVSLTLPDVPVADARPVRARPSPDLASPAPRLRLSDGVPDARLAPVDVIARAYRRAFKGLARSGLGYGDPAGDGVLREVLAGFLNQARGLSCRAEQIFITHGSQMALSLTALALCEPGDVVAVESPGYVPAWDAFSFAGARLLHVPVDEDGMDTDALRKRLTQLRGRLRAVYVTPHHQYPTTVPLAPKRRLELVRLAAEHDFTIIEDDYDYEFQFDGKPLLPLAASSHGAARTVYVGSISKLIAPAIRLGYLVGESRVLERARSRRALLDRQGDVVLERAIAELIEDGELQRHARKTRRIYAARRDVMLACLERTPSLREALEIRVPAGGLALWARVRGAVSVGDWSRHAEMRGLSFAPGSVHVAHGDLPAFRAGFASLNEREIAEAVRVLAESLAAAGGSEGPSG